MKDMEVSNLLLEQAKQAEASNPVYPTQIGPYLVAGMTTREFFAAMAMQGILSVDRTIPVDHAVFKAVWAADALCNELNKTGSVSEDSKGEPNSLENNNGKDI